MIRLGIVGTGGMANSHAQQFGKIAGVQVTACCDVVAEKAREFAARHGIPSVYSDYRAMLAAGQLDGVINVTPDVTHAEIAIAVARKGLAILSEKPMATSLAEARRMLTAVSRAGVPNMINFSYRNACALQAAARVVRAGRIGRVIHVEASYLQSWLVSRAWGDWRTKVGMTWRLSTRHGSAGVLGDLGCHIYDLASFLCGDIVEIDCRLKTFDKGAARNRIGEYVLDANDSFAATVGFRDGGLGVIHSSRWATGHNNSLRARVYGDQGAIEVDLDRSYETYRICRGRANIDAARWEEVKCRPMPSNAVRFVRAIRSGKPDASDFANGLKVQAYLDASQRSSAACRPMAVRM